jgi:hypothetical protein
MSRNKNLPSYLCRAAKAVNCLAHQLNGAQRSIGFQVKADLISMLLVAFDGNGLVRVNGVREGILGLDIVADEGRVRLHIPLCDLSPDAQLIARRLSSGAPAVGPLADRLKPEQHKCLANAGRRSSTARNREPKKDN